MKRKTMIVAVLGVVGTMAYADTTNREILVTATRESRGTLDVASDVTVITSDEIRNAGYVDVAEALKNVQGVTMRSITGNPATTEISMRGFGENSHGRVLVLLDGRRLNRPDMAGINWFEVPLSNVERIEVVRGGSTVLYGDNAVAGVVNIITRKGGKEPAGGISVDVGSYGMNSVRADISGSKNRLSYALDGERYESDGWRDRTGFSAFGFGANLGYDISKNLNASLALSGQNVKYEIPGWLSKAQMESDPRQSLNHDDSAENTYFNADFGLSSQVGDGKRIDMSLIYGRKDIVSDMTSWSSFADLIVDTYGVTPRYSMEFDTFGHQNNLLIGADFYSDILNVKRYGDVTRAMRTISADVDKTTVGGYARDEFNIQKDLVLGAGVRVESTRVDADVKSAGSTLVSDDTTHHENAFDLSLNRTIDNWCKMFTRFSTLYRYPFVDEQVSYIGYGSDQFYSDIKPEEGWNIEAGTELLIDKKTTASITVFWLEMKDEIAWNNITMRNANLDKTRHCGIELFAGHTFADIVKIDGNYTFTEAVFDDGPNDGKDIPLVPPHKASVMVELILPGDLFFDVNTTYVSSSWLGSDNSNFGEKLEGYTVVDMFLRHKSKILPGFELYAGVENAFNEKYASLGYRGFDQDGYYPSPGSTFRGGMSYRF
ncbi:MAG: TonB-dependent receptor [Kiritimatiellae bacterium]|nr:TonB-dependent receptor [Kiritimatiellia bacterium]MDD5521396.1 TonB-dependent receptor [Kiritimatiellia bacterium]